jgi:hypothetical protein
MQDFWVNQHAESSHRTRPLPKVISTISKGVSWEINPSSPFSPTTSTREVRYETKTWRIASIAQEMWWDYLQEPSAPLPWLPDLTITGENGDALFSSMQRTVMKHSSKQWSVMDTLGQWEPNMGRKNIVEIRNPILNKINLLSKSKYNKMREKLLEWLRL